MIDFLIEQAKQVKDPARKEGLPDRTCGIQGPCATSEVFMYVTLDACRSANKSDLSLHQLPVCSEYKAFTKLRPTSQFLNDIPVLHVPSSPYPPDDH
jgi:hypothetical protein